MTSQIDLINSLKIFNEGNTLPDWVSNTTIDIRYENAEDIFLPGSDFDSVKTRLINSVRAKLAEIVQVEVKVVMIDSTLEKDEKFSEYVQRVIHTYSSATFSDDDIVIKCTPSSSSESQLKGTVRAEGWLNLTGYKKRLEFERKENQAEAKKAFKQAVSNFKAGNMQGCLLSLTRSKFFIERGGGGILFDHFSDQRRGAEYLVVQFDEFMVQVIKNLAARIISPESKPDIVFKNKHNLNLRVELYSPEGVKFDFSNIDLTLISSRDSNAWQRTDRTDHKGKVQFNLLDAQLDADPRPFIVQPDLSMIGQTSIDEHWFQTQAYKQFIAQFKLADLTIAYVPFTKLNTTYFVSRDAGIYRTEINTNQLYNVLENELSKHAQFFNLMARMGGKYDVGFEMTLAANKKLSKSQIKDLSACDIVLNLHIGKSRGFKDQRVYIPTIRMFSVADDQFVTLGSLRSPAPVELSDMEDEISKLYQKFLDAYFYRSLLLETNINDKFTVTINDQEYVQKKNIPNLVVKDLSRYHQLDIGIVSPRYRKLSLKLAPKDFSLVGTIAQMPQLANIEKRTVTLEKYAGSFEVHSFDADNYQLLKDVPGRSKTEIWQPWWWFFKQNQHTLSSVSSAEFSDLIPGLYLVSVTQPGYSKPIPKPFILHDDLASEKMQVLNIYLNEKSTLTSLSLSTLLPGMGHWYLGKPKWQVFTPASVYLVALAASYKYYWDYQSSKSQFIDQQNKYFSANTTDQIQLYHHNSQQAWDTMVSAKRNMVFLFSSAIATNVLTDVMLYVQKEVFN